MAADCLAAPRRNVEADSAAPWRRAPPLDHVPAAGVRAAETPLHDRTAGWEPSRHSVGKLKKFCSHINCQTLFITSGQADR